MVTKRKDPADMTRLPYGANRFVDIGGVQHRRCNQCGPTLVKNFGPLGKSHDGLAYTCTPCRRAYAKRHYEDNSADYQAKAARNRLKAQQRIRDWLCDFLDGKMCECGNSPRYLVYRKVGTDLGIRDVIAQGHSLESVASMASACDAVCEPCLGTGPTGFPSVNLKQRHSYVDLLNLPFYGAVSTSLGY